MRGPEFNVQPIVSTDAILCVHDPQAIPAPHFAVKPLESLPTQVHSRSRIRQVFLTSVPLVTADLIAVAVCFWIATVLVSVYSGRPVPLNQPNQLLALCLTFAGLGLVFGIYPATSVNPVYELRQLITVMMMSCVVLFMENGLLGEVSRMELLTVIGMFPLALVQLPAMRFMTRRICPRWSWWGEEAIVVGAGPQGRAVFEFLASSPQRGLKPVGLVDSHPEEFWKGDSTDSSIPFLGTTEELVQICRERQIHWVIAAVADRSPAEVSRVLNYGSLINNLVVLSSPVLLPSLWVKSFEAGGLNGIHIQDRMLLPFHRICKRVLDIVLASLLLLLVSPFVLIAALLIRANSKGPIFFRHERIGRGGRRFDAFKIRTMVPDAPQILQRHLAEHPAARAEWELDQKLKHDPRIIPRVGEFLRQTSLDEIPQLWNVIQGDMSLVGPRPIVDDEIAKYRAAYPMYLRVRPGLTGLWQISGRNNTTYDARVRLDTYYVRNWSMWLDYFILLRTVRTVVFREGSY